jgi:exoribonuclease R
VAEQRGAASERTQARRPLPGTQAEARSDERGAAAARTLVSAVLAAWPADQPYPLAAVRASLGQAGCIEVETRAMLEMEGVADVPFGPEVLACLPPVPWTIGAAELAGRRDFRSARCARARGACCRVGWQAAAFRACAADLC